MEFKPFKIGKYLLLEKLATGGMAEVYRAKASGAGGFEKQLAIKRILPSYSANDEFRRMFEYEARLSSMLTHSNIVQIYDFVKSGETYLLAMEYVDGKNLRQFVNKVKKLGLGLPIEFGVWVINEVCKGLEYAHKKKDDLTGRPLNIIHRDMSPQNIMLSYEGSVKIVDFGIAKAKDRVDETRSGVIKGKFGYMSPEQANGEPVDHRTDIFSTGIILYELLTSRRLFASENDMATLKLIQECIIPPPSRFNPKINSDLEKMVMKVLTKDLTLRYQSAGSFNRSLQEYLAKYSPSFTQREVHDILQKVFAEEIDQEKRRFEQIYRQSIPFSQGDHKSPATDFDDIEEALDGESTKSEQGQQSAVTFVEEEPLADEDPSSFEGSGSKSETRVSEVSDPEDRPGVTEVEIVLPEEEESVPTESAEPKAPRKPVKQPPPKPQSADTEERTVAGPERASAKEAQMPVLAPGKEGSVSYRQNTNTGTVKKSEATRVQGTSLTGRKEPGTFAGTGTGTKANTNPASHLADKILTGREAQASPFLGRRPAAPAATPTLGKPRLSLDREQTGVGTQTSTQNRSRNYPEREDYLPRKKKSRALLSLMGFLAIVSVTVLGYRFALNGGVPTMIEKIEPRTITNEDAVLQPPVNVKAPRPANPAPNSATSAGAVPICTTAVDSDPSGARVFVDGAEKGITSTTIAAPCNRAINLTLRLDGFERIDENIVIRERMDRIYRTLRKIPTGTLELTMTENCRIFVDGAFVKEAVANERTEIQVKANQKHSLRFVNEIYKLESNREFVVGEDAVLRETIRLDDARPKVSPPSQPRAGFLKK